jgi:hypothetical protein
MQCPHIHVRMIIALMGSGTLKPADVQVEQVSTHPILAE